MTDRALGAPFGLRVAMFVYLLAPLVVYPTVWIIIHDFPTLTDFELRRYLVSSELSHFRFEEAVLAASFIILFVFIYTRLFVQQSRIRFLITTAVLAGSLYGAGTYVVGDSYPLSLFKEHYSCQRGLPTCYPVLIFGYIMFFSVVFAILLSKASLKIWNLEGTNR